MKTISDMSTADVLRRSKAELIRRGWYQGYFYPRDPGVSFEDCPVCPLGAVAVVLHGNPDRYFTDEIVRPVEIALRQALPPGFNSVANYNDRDDRTLDEVLALFDRAIEASA